MAKGKFLVLFLTLLLGIFTVAWATDIYVPTDQPTIQAAITAASNGDVIHVAAGTYPEALGISSAKQLTIIGAGSTNTIIQPAAGSHAINITPTTAQSLSLQDIQLVVSGAGVGIRAQVELSNSTLSLTNVEIKYGSTGRGILYGTNSESGSTGNSITISNSQINRVNPDGTGEDRGIYYNSDNSTLTVTNSTITAGHYAIVMNGALFTANITGSNLTGFSALNLWTNGSTGNHSVVNVDNSILTGRTYWDGPQNTYATIAFSGWYTTVNVTNSTITNQWVGSGNSFQGLALAYNQGANISVENVLNLDSATQLINTNTDYAPWTILSGGADFKWYIDNVLQEIPVFADWYVNDSLGNDSNTGKYPAVAFKTIQHAIDVAAAGDVIYIADGNYSATTTLNVYESLSIIGESEAGVVIDLTAVDGYGIDIKASNVTLQNMTLLPNPTNDNNHYTIKTNPAALPAFYENLVLDHITINGSCKSAFDVNGYNNVTLSNLHATNTLSGVGVAISGCDGVTLSNITTSGNAWGGVAVYVSTWVNRGSNNVNFDFANSTLADGIYVENESGLVNTNINILNYTYGINNFHSPDNFVTYTEGSLADALAVGAGLNGKFSNATSYVWANADPILNYYVGPGMTIQAAINVAADDDVINVAAGTYTENVVINKQVSVKGPEARVKPIIDGGGTGTVVTITASGALLDGFQIQHSGSTQADAGIMIYGASNCTVKNNLVTGNANGIGVAVGGNNTVQNNAVNTNQFFGIVLIASDGNTLQSNTISTIGGVAGACDGIVLTNLTAFGGDITNGSNGNNIKGNNVTSGHDGIYFDENCGGNYVTDGNVFTGCVDNALHMWRIGGQTITGNTFSNSVVGIRMRGSANNTITGNTITGNQKGIEAISSWQLGVWYSSAPNTITGNNFTLNAPINFDNRDNLQDAENQTLNLAAILSGNTYDRSILVDQVIYRNAAILYVQAPNELIKDNELQVYSVKVADVTNLRGFSIQIKIPAADFNQPNVNTDFAIGLGYTSHTIPGSLMPVLYSGIIDGYHTYDVSGNYLGGGPTSGITGSDVELFKVNLTSLINRDNIAMPGCNITLPLTGVLMYDANNPIVNIPCAGTLPEFILIDATEPVFAAIPQIPGQPLPTFQDPVGAVDPTFLTLSVSDNYNLDYVMYLIQPAGTDPTTIAQFSSSVVSGITGAAWNNGGANWEIPNDVLNGLAQGEHEIFFLAVDDAGNFTISPSWNFIIDTLPPDPIVWWTEAQAVGDFSPCRTSVNANNSIDLKWTNPAGTVKVQIWRHCYGDDTTYPEYGLTGFTLPAAPNPYLASDPNGWVRLTNEVTGTTYTDTSMPRGYYYYTLFAEDASGNLSAAPAAPFYRESISYWPGDVEANYGAVDPDDIARLSVAWGATPTNGLPWNNLVDVGPSTDYARRSRPVPDNVINIHDMMMFAMNYNNTDYSLYYRQEEEETAPIAITLNAVQSGETLTLTLLLADNGGNLRGLNIPIRYGSGLSLQGYEAGEIWPETSLMLHTDADRVVTLSGAALGAEATVAGDGVIATVTFAITGADDSFELMRMLAFSEFNHEIEIVNNPTGNVDNDDLVNVIPESSYLGSSYPNPFRGSTTLTYGVKEAGGVRVTVFNSRGQLIRSLVNDSKAPGTYQIVWDGRDDSGQPASSGIYFFRLETKGLVKTHKALMLK